MSTVAWREPQTSESPEQVLDHVRYLFFFNCLTFNSSSLLHVARNVKFFRNYCITNIGKFRFSLQSTRVNGYTGKVCKRLRR